MTRRSVHTSWLALALAAGFVSFSCKKKDEPVETAPTAAASMSQASPATLIPIDFVPTAEQQALVQELIAKVDEAQWVFPPTALKEQSGPDLFVYLAASSETPAVIAASLRAMARLAAAKTAEAKATKGAKPTGTQGASDDDFARVVEVHAGSTSPRIQARALEAAEALLQANPKHGLSGKLAELGKSSKFESGPARYDLMATLSATPAPIRGGFGDLYRSYLDAPEAYVTARALEDLLSSARHYGGRGQLVPRLTALMENEDAATRGRAIELLGEVGKGREEVPLSLLGKLKDDSPFVRSKTATALAELRYHPAVHQIMALLDDKAEDSVESPAWKTLEGRAGRRVHRGSTHGHVANAALGALQMLSGGDLKLTPPDPAAKDGQAKNIAAARAWYAKAKSTIPNPDATAKATAPVGTTKPNP